MSSNKGRNLPPWMTSKEGEHKQSSTSSMAKLLDGVVFALSGFVNPERGVLRSQAMEMGAEYKTDWNPECTLLICAFSNTPKFRQVVADCGTIVSKEWIVECYQEKKLVAIEPYLMHVGKPWRKVTADQETTPLDKPQKPVKKDIKPKPSIADSSEGEPAKGDLSPAKVKKWAIDDLMETIAWLESQEERPDAGEVKKIASEGILTCLQDAIESLEQNKGIQEMIEQWRFIPRVVKELARLDDMDRSEKSFNRKDLCRQAMTCKRIYEMEFNLAGDDSTTTKKKKKGHGGHGTNRKNIGAKASGYGYDSDETLEMTEEEIDLAYNVVASNISKR
ncbi:hypothetical protein Sjap_019387 [Stephania japonica]|uniref:BRCT domain-containing protein n=1 Tax=Stephania japonica TaxID=461633 RepID=A0AAP0HUP1_9MAGN